MTFNPIITQKVPIRNKSVNKVFVKFKCALNESEIIFYFCQFMKDIFDERLFLYFLGIQS
jgi:hypothetical protein